MLKQIFTYFLISTSFASSFFYPNDYSQARSNFLKDVQKIQTIYKNTQLTSFEVSKGLFTDYLYIKPAIKTDKLIVITSGTHGPEGYIGSVLQSIFLNKYLKNINLNATGILLIHALNPWGFANNRRGTESNVNLNRNFALSDELFKTRNQAYQKLAYLLEIKEPIHSTWNFPAASLLNKVVFEKDVSIASLTEAIGKGQYTNERGINFGGKSFEPQTVKTIELFKEITPKYKKILHIDFHTGLGDRGVLHIMTKPSMNERSKQHLNKMFLDNDSKELFELTSEKSKGFYSIQGDHAEIISKINPSPKKTIIGITAEFGTVGKGLIGKIGTINWLIRENRGHFSGYGNQDVKKEIRKDYIELFNPSDSEWREETIKKGSFLLDTVVKRFLK